MNEWLVDNSDIVVSVASRCIRSKCVFHRGDRIESHYIYFFVPSWSSYDSGALRKTLSAKFGLDVTATFVNVSLDENFGARLMVQVFIA